MQTGNVTTPFGRRPMTLGMLVSQHRAHDIDEDQSVDKWQIFRALCEAKPLLGVSDRALAVLNALLSFYPGNILSARNGLIVFPSNEQLSIRAHGIASATLRRHLAALTEAGLLLRKDSPNGKRYARRREGEIDQAYGFSIAPLIARANEFRQMAASITADRQQLRATRERLSLCRRDIAKLLEAAAGEGAPGHWLEMHAQFRSIVDAIPRVPTLHHLTPLVVKLEALRQEIINSLESYANGQNLIANESHFDRHKEESNPESIYESERDRVLDAAHASCQLQQGEEGIQNDKNLPTTPKSESGISLGLVLQACPEIANYGPAGCISGWRDLMTAANVVRSMLGASAACYEKCCTILGPHQAAVIMACILEKADRIQSAGAYLTDLVRRAEQGTFSITPMLIALHRARKPSQLN